MLFDVLVMILSLAAAAYAHLRLGYHTATHRHALAARAALLLVGLALGWTATLWVPGAPSAVKTVVFLSAFGVVHVPAAAILFIKRRRGVYQ